MPTPSNQETKQIAYPMGYAQLNGCKVGNITSITKDIGESI